MYSQDFQLQMSCVLLIDVPGTLMCDQFEVLQFQLHFSGVVLDIVNGFQKLTMVVGYGIFEWDVDFYIGEPGFQVFLGWLSTVDMTEMQELAVNPMVQILITIAEALPDQFQ